MQRCAWAPDHDTLMCEYHDHEYGRKKDNDKELFEKLCLECFQAGLSWRTVLYKRDAFRECFFDFDPVKAAEISQEYVEKLMQDTRIIRNRRKIEAVVSNAKKHCVIFGEDGSFRNYVYSFRSGDALSKDLKKKGYRFVGPTICESFLMSVGAVEGHEKSCFFHKGDM